MLTVIYSEKGKCISDFEAESFVDSFVENYLKSKEDVVFNTSSELVLSYFVLKVENETLRFENVKFFYKEYEMICDPVHGLEYPKDETGRMISFGFSIDVTRRIIDVCVQRMRNNVLK